MLKLPDEPAVQVTPSRSISLLPVISELFEKLLFRRLKQMISTIDQVQRIVNFLLFPVSVGDPQEIVLGFFLYL